MVDVDSLMLLTNYPWRNFSIVIYRNFKRVDCSLEHTFVSETLILQVPVKPTFALRTYQRISKPFKLTIAFLCYLFRGVAPHPNYPPISVLNIVNRNFSSKSGISLSGFPSHIFYIWMEIMKSQAVVKLHGDFSLK